MKAVIMAGGEGSRLRPLTCDIPKPMAPVCGKPVIRHICELLENNGFDSAVVTLGYLPDVITDYFRDEPMKSLELNFVQEKIPLGTAGGVKNALGEQPEDVLVISGDAICDFDLKKVCEFHSSKGAAATIVTVSADDPREYGLVSCDEKGRVTGFVEKPSWSQAVTDRANTGIYVLSKEVFQLIPSGVPCDFANDIFPEMLRTGMPVFACEGKGYWCDIGDLNSYLSCQLDVINGHVNIAAGSSGADSFLPGSGAPAGCKIFPPVFIGERVRAGEGAVIGPNAVIGNGVFIGAQARVRNSVLMDNCAVDERASLTGAILCQGASVKNGASVFEGAVLGTRSVVGENARIMTGICVWPGKTVGDGAVVDTHVKYSDNSGEVFGDDGISGTAGIDMVPDFCANIGAAIGSVKGILRCGAACGEGAAARALTNALISGMQSTGASVWNFGLLTENVAVFAASHCELPIFAYVTGGARCRVKIYVGGGLPSDRRTEREIASRLSHRDFIRCSWEEYRAPVLTDRIESEYGSAVCGFAREGLEGTAATVTCCDRNVESRLCELLASLGCKKSGELRFQLSQEGTSVSVFGDSTGYVPPRRILALLCKLEFEEGRDVRLEANAPLYLDTIAEKYGRRIIRGSPVSDGKSRLLFYDGMMQTVRILAAVKSSGKSLDLLLEDVPDIAFVSRRVELSVSPGRMMEKMSDEGEFTGEGIRITRDGAALVLTPSKKGRFASLVAESADSETARELCGEIERKIAAITLDTRQ